ncbi:hypothetical protein ACFRR7_00695 [Streptomyces sp. NPDC056909]|uniref:hypothetical protein n=1 Tax=Streptomyces sp. NPDC056909 TaxID=3345963 RepID=UPI00368C4A4D
MLKTLARAMTAAALIALPLTATTPAHATYEQCFRYLQNMGYPHPLLSLQCQLGEGDYTYAYRDCVDGLTARNVQRAHANEACRLAHLRP